MTHISRTRRTAACALLAASLPAVLVMTSGSASAASGTVAPSSSITLKASGPVITSAAPLGVAALGSSYRHQFTATGDPAPTWSVSAGRLPAGLTLNPSTGVLSGTPTGLLALSTFTVRATNSQGSATQNATILVVVGGTGTTTAAPRITSPLPIGATVGGAYTHQFTATGNPAPSWSVTNGVLPAGLTLNPTTGLLSGNVAAVVGAYTFTVTASNALGANSQTVVLAVVLGSGNTTKPAITSPLPVGAIVGNTPYTHQFTAIGTPAPTWSVASGSLPPGFTLNPTTGLLTGTPTGIGVYVFTVRATNSAGTADQPVTIVFVAGATAPTITSGVPLSGTVGLAYDHQFVATGVPAATWSVTSGSLPAGLTLNATTGTVSGIPTAAGSSTFTVRATNSAGTAEQTNTVTVATAGSLPVVTNVGRVVGTVGQALNVGFTATGNPAPTWAVQGNLPAGLFLNSTTGVVSGVPTTAGTTTVTLRATNVAGVGNLPVSFVIYPATRATLPAPGTYRWDGPNRTTTAIDVSQSLFPLRASAPAVVVTTSENYADAIGGGRLASSVGAPLLLTGKTALDADVAAEVKRVLAPGGTIYVLGGTPTLTDDVTASLQNLDASFRISRLAGNSRFETGVAIADEILRVTGSASATSSPKIYLANGRNFPDGLAVSALAARTGGVVLLTENDTMPDATAAFVAAHDPTGVNTVPIGGAAAVASMQLPTVQARAATANAVVGADRYDTSSKVAALFTKDSTSTPVASVGLATGANWPDALVGAAAMGALNGPLLLTAPTELDSAAQTSIAGLNAVAPVEVGIVFGGELALDGTVYSDFSSLIPKVNVTGS